MINAKLQSILDTKSAIGNAITNKGGTITSNTPFFNYAAQIDGISTGAGAYSNFVAQAQDNSKYTVYTGYDSITNPTPNLSNNFAFNQWLLNNSATGDVVLSNVVVAVGGIFNGPNASVNEASMPFVTNSIQSDSTVEGLTSNDGFIYALFRKNSFFEINKFYENNLTFVSNINTGSSLYGSALHTNNGFVYADGANNQVRKYHESNLVLSTNSTNNVGLVYTIQTNNGFVYAGGTGSGFSAGFVRKYHESNLVAVGNTASYGGQINELKTNNGFIYIVGDTNQTIQKFHESNLAFVGNSGNFGGDMFSLTINNGFIYAGGELGGYSNGTVKRYYESNLAFDEATANYGGYVKTITINNGFIYAGGQNENNIKKYYESNLAFLGNTASYGGLVETAITNNGFIYVVGRTNQTVQKFQETGLTPDNQTFYNITQIKE
jgi:hypothetical protein